VAATCSGRRAGGGWRRRGPSRQRGHGPGRNALLAALAAGEAAGGDKRGKQAARCASTADEDYPQLDIRVDDHEEPVQELERLYRKSLERYQPFMACLAGRKDPVGITDRAVIEERIARFHREREGPQLMAVLEVRGLRTEFRTDDGDFPAVDGVSFSVEAGRRWPSSANRAAARA
jgi:hypothetical protein